MSRSSWSSANSRPITEATASVSLQRIGETVEAPPDHLPHTFGDANAPALAARRAVPGVSSPS